LSFSANVKEEVSKLNTLKDKESVKAELIGYLLTSNTSVIKNKIRFSTENEYNINRFNKLLNSLDIDYSIEMQGNTYVIIFKKLNMLDIIEYDNKDVIIKNNNISKNLKTADVLLKSIVRGSFLGAGSINNPKKTYHLEIVFSNKNNALFIKDIVDTYEIDSKELTRNQNYSLYIKEGEDISKFLALIGASSAVLEFEEIRVIKDMRNNVNRIVNCETANINKIVNTAVRQVEDIKLIQSKGKFKELPENLQEIAILRLENKDVSLLELGQMLKKPIGKSGVNHRLKKISEIAKEMS